MAELDDYRILANTLADMTSAQARADWLSAGQVSYKADGSALTRTDLAIERTWRTHLQEVVPDHGILGEEFGTDAGRSAYTWVLDPIDGTRRFAAGLMNFTSLIALCRDGVPVLGLMDLPAAGVRFTAVEGGGTFRDGTRIRTSGRGSFGDAVVSLANAASFGTATRPGYDALRRRGRLHVYDGGSPAYGALASGRIDLCLNGEDLDAFDICALCPIVTEAGGAITDWSSGPLGLTSHGPILASASPALHRAALACL